MPEICNFTSYLLYIISPFHDILYRKKLLSKKNIIQKQQKEVKTIQLSGSRRRVMTTIVSIYVMVVARDNIDNEFDMDIQQLHCAYVCIYAKECVCILCNLT